MEFKLKTFVYVISVLFIPYAELYQFEKRWIKTNSWKESSNWDPPGPPCPNDNIVLTHNVYIKDTVTFNTGLSLPTNGEIILGPNVNLVFGNLAETRMKRAVSQCDNKAKKVTFIGQHEKQWLNPNNWDIYKDGKKDEYTTKAAPYIERVPCLHDRVSFPEGNAFKIDIVDNITVKDVVINGDVITQNTKLQSYMSTEEGKIRFNTSSPGGSLNLDSTPCGEPVCACRNDAWRKKICRTFTCPAKKCKREVQPRDCCKHCGGMIDFTYNGTFDLGNCSSELRARLNGESKYAGVRLYMFNSQNKIKILVSEDNDGRTAESAASFIGTYINEKSSGACNGEATMSNVRRGKHIGKDETSAVSITFAIILPILLLAIIIIVGAYFHTKRKSPIIKQRFVDIDDFSNFPGVDDLEMTSEFTNYGELAFENPICDLPDIMDGNEVKRQDTKIDDETIGKPKEPRYVELELPEKGVANPMYDREHTNESHRNECPEKTTADELEEDLESANTMDSIKVKLQLRVSSDTEDDSTVHSPYDEVEHRKLPEPQKDWVTDFDS